MVPDLGYNFVTNIYFDMNDLSKSSIGWNDFYAVFSYWKKFHMTTYKNELITIKILLDYHMESSDLS